MRGVGSRLASLRGSGRERGLADVGEEARGESVVGTISVLETWPMIPARRLSGPVARTVDVDCTSRRDPVLRFL